MSATRPEQLYETDFYAWTQAQAKELRRFARARPNLPLDLAHIAEEIRDIQHFLMIEHSPASARPREPCPRRAPTRSSR